MFIATYKSSIPVFVREVISVKNVTRNMFALINVVTTIPIILVFLNDGRYISQFCIRIQVHGSMSDK